MRVLVYGAGNIGTLYAALLQESGADVSVLARGERLARLRREDVELVRHATGERTSQRLTAVEALDPDAVYDLVLVALPSASMEEVLPRLAQHRRSPNVLFFGNRFRGPEALVAALGRERVLLGFPGAAAVERDGRLVFIITSAREQPTTIGELDGRRSERLEAIASMIRGAGFPVAIEADMDAWLKTHIAKIAPTAGALYACAVDLARMTRTRDALVLMVRGIHEGFALLEAHGVVVTPANHRVLRFIPEPILVSLIRLALSDDAAAIKIGHADHGRAEVAEYFDELRALSESLGVDPPSLARLSEFVDRDTPPLPDGERDLRMRRGGCLALAIVPLAALTVLWLTFAPPW